MKVHALLCACLAVFCSAVASASESAVPMPKLQSCGDVSIDRMGECFASRLMAVNLLTNEASCVACQVFYCDRSPSTDDGEIALKDKYFSRALTMFLGNVCAGMTAEELLEEYRLGLMYLYLDDFRVNVNAGLKNLGIEVVAVSMRAVGEFAQRVAE